MLVILGVLAFAVLIFFVIYNGLIAKKNNVEQAFSTIDVQLKQRYDLIPNLVAAVKTYMTHERGTLEELTKLRAQAVSGTATNDQRVQLDGQISKALGGIMVAVENYPQLKADTSFVNLQRSLNEIEAQIAAARRTYNAAVTEFNNAIQMFPSNIIAGMLGYTRKEVFAAAEAERANPNVGALFNN